MPYQFVDTIEHTSSETMPAEALKLNGEYIENQMDARYAKYRTLYVSGREALSPEITSFTTGVRDGEVFLSRKYPARTITVGFYLAATSNYYFRMAWNELNRILNVEDAECIFYDEQDKYFTGTPSGIGEVPAGTNFIQAEFTIFCPDPFKYSITEYEVEPTEDDGTTFVIDYNGTYKSFPELEADFAADSECGTTGNSTSGMTVDGDCGYVAWFNEDAKIIQLGDPEEDEGESFDKSQTLFSQDFRNVSGWTAPLNNIWSAGSIYVGTSYWAGAPNKAVLEPSTSPGGSSYYLTGSFGSRSSGYWYGSGVTRMIPADATGVTGAKDWTLKWSQKLCIGNGSKYNVQRGGIQVIVTNAYNTVIAAANMYKGADDAGSTGRISFFLYGKKQKTVTGVDFSYRNARWGNNSDTFKSVKSCSMVKSGSTVKFNLGGTTWSFTSSSISGLSATQITIMFLARSDYDILRHQGVFEVTFTKDNCTTWRDIPNKFTNNDVAIARCSDGTVLMNNAESPEYGALGNDWESFYLQPGINQIGFSYSDWCEQPPTTKLRYREVFL